MEIHIKEQLIIFLQSIVCGFFLGVVYEAFRTLHKIHKNSAVLMFFEDVIYAIISALITFLFIMAVNKGEIRAYILIGIAIGFLSYYQTLGRILNKLFELVFRCVSNVVKKLFAPLKKLILMIKDRLKGFRTKNAKKSKKIITFFKIPLERAKK